MICGEDIAGQQALSPGGGDGAIQAEHGRYQMSYETLPVHSPAHKVLTAPYRPQADRRTHANKKLAGSISRTSHLQLSVRHRATYMTSRVRYAWVSVHSVRFVSTGTGEGPSLGQVLHIRFLLLLSHSLPASHPLYHRHPVYVVARS